MSNQTERSETYINALASFISKTYNLSAVSLIPTKRGFYGETWQLVSCEKRYFVKLVYFTEYQPTYERSFEVINFLCSKGINFISTVIKTSQGRLFTHFDGAVLGVFDWIDGENIETNETKILEYQMLARVYTVSPIGIEIPREDFSGNSANTFFKQCQMTKDKKILSLLEKKRTFFN